MNRSRQNARGFTLVELTVTLVIVTLISAFVIPRFVAKQSFDARGYFEEVVSAARYAQKVAIANNCSMQWVMTSTGYQINRMATFCDNAGYPQVLAKPSGGNFSGSTPTGVSVGGVPVTIVFHANGSTTPSTDTTVTVGSFTMIIRGVTGFIETVP